MAIPNPDTVKVESTVTGESIGLTINREADAHIMSVVTNLYEDSELACVREYSTNARDSHIAAGVTRPIEVHTPSTLKPLLEIVDYGTGMDDADIRDTYSQYGASTKRDSNDVVGMLGLGCKSALAYTDAFTLVTVKDGKRYTCQVSREHGGGGSITITDVSPTDEANGVRVQIPARRDNNFREKAYTLFAYWPEGSVLVDGEAPDTLDGIVIGGGDYVVVPWQRARYYEQSSQPRLTVVMGGVPYPAPGDYEHPVLKSLSADKGLVCFAPIGTVPFAPSRETLLDGPGTRKALDALLVAFENHIQAEVTSEVEGANTHRAAAMKLVELRDVYGDRILNGVTYRGEVIPLTLELPNTNRHTYWHNAGRVRGRYYGRQGHNERYRVQNVSINEAAHSVWVLDYQNEHWTKSNRDKLVLYLQREGKMPAGVDSETLSVIMTTAVALPHRKWLGDVTHLRWETVRKWKDPQAPKPERGKGGNGARRGTYPVYLPAAAGGGYQEDYPAASIDPEQYPVYYSRGGRYAYGRHRYLSVLPDGYVVGLNDNRVDKFKRLYPTAKPLHTAAETVASEWWDGLTPAQQSVCVLDCESVWSRLGAAADPDLVTLAGILTTDTPAGWDKYSAFLSPTLSDDTAALLERVQNRYPLIHHIGYGERNVDTQHFILYADTVYASQ